MPLDDPIPRPKRWNVPFSAEMPDSELADADVEDILTKHLFRELDTSKFSGKITLDGILKNDARLMRYQPGDIIIRKGDWGNSTFVILSGTVRVQLSPNLPPEMLGRRTSQRKSFFQVLAQLWNRPKDPEVRDPNSYQPDSRVASRGSGEHTRIYLQDLSVVLDHYHTVQMQAGHLFGELSAIGRTERSANVFADSDACLLEIRWQGLKELMRDEKFRTHLDELFRSRALGAFLRDIPIFQHLTSEQINEVTKLAEFHTLGDYEWGKPFVELARKGETQTHIDHEPIIAEEGDYPNGVILIRNGLARLSQRYHHGDRTFGYLMGRHIYGFEEIEEGWHTGQAVPLRFSLRALGYTGVVLIPTPAVEKYLLDTPHRERVKRRTDRPHPFVPSASATEIEQIGPDFVEFLVQNRFINGTATLLIDLDRCTRCDDCVQACASTHDNNPRFLRHGPVQDNIMIAGACMHCIDPVCMIGCPTGAIHRDLTEGVVVINDRTCIGCSVCQQNCPYHAIRMVEVRDDKGELLRSRDPKSSVELPIVKATKCDLCIDQIGGPACQRACPHDALVRMDMQEVETLAQWRNQ